MITCSPDETAFNAALKMEDNRVGCVIVIGPVRIAGIATRYDFIHHLVVKGLDPRTTSISRIMHTAPVTIESSKTMLDALSLMAAKKVERLIVVRAASQKNSVLGVISLEDVISSLESSEVFRYMSVEKAEQIRAIIKKLTPFLLARYSGEERSQIERDLSDETKALLMLLEESEISLRA